MDEALSVDAMTTEQDRRIAEAIGSEQSRLRNFIRRRVPDASDAEDILQDVFYELIEANRLMKPIERVGAWLFRVARNRITDLFRKRKFAGVEPAEVTGGHEPLLLEDLLPSPDAGPDADYARGVLHEELAEAID
ncbi:MAG: RNA polymerase sigma factor, partial [Thermoanaerobaculia bacterium]